MSYFDDIKNINLTEKNNFKIIDINYSDDEIKTLKIINVVHNRSLHLFGTYDLVKKIKILIDDTLNNNDSEKVKIVKIIKNIIWNVIKGSISAKQKSNIKNAREQSAFIIIRVTKPNILFKIPRWHADGNYYKRKTPYRKFVTTLIGPQTMFYKNSKIDKKKMKTVLEKYPVDRQQDNRKLFRKQIIKQRKEIVKFMNNESKIFKPKKYQAGVYLVGPYNYSAFHSEPDKNMGRIFIAILPGTKNEINEMKKRGK